jgi:hypothetical protein
MGLGIPRSPIFPSLPRSTRHESHLHLVCIRPWHRGYPVGVLVYQVERPPPPPKRVLGRRGRVVAHGVRGGALVEHAPLAFFRYGEALRFLDTPQFVMCRIPSRPAFSPQHASRRSNLEKSSYSTTVHNAISQTRTKRFSSLIISSCRISRFVNFFCIELLNCSTVELLVYISYVR